MTYFDNALLEVLLLGLLSGVAGFVVLLRKRAFFTVALSHATFPGGVIAALLGFSVLAGSAIFALLLIAIMTGLSRVRQQGKQVASGLVLTFGFALGALIQSMNPASPIPVDALLIGSLLSVSTADVLALAVVLVVSLGILLMISRRLVYSSFDPEGYRSSGFKPWLVDAAALTIIAAAVVVAMPAVGAILGVAIIVGPAITARMLVRNVMLIAPVAALFGIAAGLAGLYASKAFDIAAGGAVGLAVAVIFAAVALGRQLAIRLKAGKGGDGSH